MSIKLPRIKSAVVGLNIATFNHKTLIRQGGKYFIHNFKMIRRQLGEIDYSIRDLRMRR